MIERILFVLAVATALTAVAGPPAFRFPKGLELI